MPSSFHIMLQTSFGLQVQVQLVPLMQVYITVDESFQGKTCGETSVLNSMKKNLNYKLNPSWKPMLWHLFVYAGICGNFNKVLSDDLKTPQGVVEGTAISFANSWKAQSNCPDRTERQDDPCSYSSDSGERLFASKVNVAMSDRLVFNFVFVLFYTYTEGFISRLYSNRFGSDQEHLCVFTYDRKPHQQVSVFFQYRCISQYFQIK